MKISYLFVLLALFSIVVFGCTSQTQPTKNSGEVKKADGTIVKADGTMVKPDGTMVKPDGTMIKTDGTMVKPDGTMIGPDGKVIESKQSTSGTAGAAGYTGKVLAETEATKYLDFNKADYDKALKEKKKILLYFYANWCPICRIEQPQTFAAFNEIKDPDLIGFRVNYRDSDTDADEESLAKEFGVSYQHTKVILKDGQRVGKFPDSWDKQRYLDELRKI